MKSIFNTPSELVRYLLDHDIPFVRRSKEVILVPQNNTKFCFCMYQDRLILAGVGAGGLQISVSQFSYDPEKPQYLTCEDGHRVVGSILFGGMENE